MVVVVNIDSTWMWERCRELRVTERFCTNPKVSSCVVYLCVNKYSTTTLRHCLRDLTSADPSPPSLCDRTTDDDKKRRLRAFLTCLQSDTQMMRSSVYVPQHLLILACVLRSVLGGGLRYGIETSLTVSYVTFY